MCTTFFSFKRNEKYPVIIAFNRDEFYNRPTQSIQHWDDAPWILAPRDLERKGTWFGVTLKGRLGFLTNYREPCFKEDMFARGELVAGYLKTTIKPADYLLNDVRPKQCNGYNIVLGDYNQLYYYCNREDLLKILEPGIYGLSNGVLNAPWPKVIQGNQFFSHITSVINNEDDLVESLIILMHNELKPSDHELLDTGLEYNKEKSRSSLFVRGKIHGTRSTIVLYMREDGVCILVEQIYHVNGKKGERLKYYFKIY